MFTYTINGINFSFYNSYNSNRSGFNHFSDLFINGRNIASNKIHYINRTWEAYTFQSVNRGALYGFIDSLEYNYITAWKNTHGVKRLTKLQRAAVLNSWNDPEYIAARELLAKI